MKIKETIHRKVAVLTLRGKLMGPPDTTEFYQQIEQLLEEGVSRIVVDMHNVNWINSIGVGTLMKCLKLVQRADGHLHLANLSDKVQSIFAMSQLTKVFSIHNDVDAGIKELNQT